LRSKSSLSRRNVLVGSSALAAGAFDGKRWFDGQRLSSPRRSQASPVRQSTNRRQPLLSAVSAVPERQADGLSLYSERNTLSSPVAIVLSVVRICPDEVSR
jgi:hypothetical protein